MPRFRQAGSNFYYFFYSRKDFDVKNAKEILGAPAAQFGHANNTAFLRESIL